MVADRKGTRSVKNVAPALRRHGLTGSVALRYRLVEQKLKEENVLGLYKLGFSSWTLLLDLAVEFVSS